MRDLKPCPFCGSSAKVYVWTPGVSIGCSNDACDIETGWEPSEGDAVAKWNARAETRAQWILRPEIPFGEPDKECSRCHVMSPVWSYYCHACGAKMDTQEEAP